MPKSSTPSFVLTLKLNTSKHDERVLAQRFLYGQRMYNTLVRHARKQLFKMQSDKEYRRLLAEYISLKGDKPEIKKQRALLGKELSRIRIYYRLSEYQFHDFVSIQQHIYARNIDSFTAQKIASAVWKSVDDVLFGGGKKVHFKKYYDFYSMEGKTNTTGIRYKNGRLHWNGLIIGVSHNKKDIYQQLALQNRVKYCRIKRQVFGTRYHYYLELILEGVPPMKHTIGTGEVGIDIGTSTVAVVADNYCLLDELAKEAGSVEKEKRVIQRKLDRSRRKSNSDNYNQNGTVKKNYKKWIKSKSYKKLEMKYKNVCWKRAAIVKQSHEILANKILEHGNIVRVEKMSFSGLSKKSKESEHGKNGKFKSRKRFGKSIGSRAPAILLEVIDRKLKYIGNELIKVNTVTFRASQYNHVTDEYVKKKLNHRYIKIQEDKIQRDLYSAFLIKNSNQENTYADRNKCLQTYENFKIQHDKCISNLLIQSHKYPTSMGLKHFCNCQ